MMRALGPFSIGLLEAVSMLAWTLAVIACFIAVEKQDRSIAAILLALAAFGAVLTGSGHSYAEATNVRPNRLDSQPAVRWRL